MDAFIESLSQLLIEWGLPGMFIAALLAGSIVPFSSEVVMIALIKLGLDSTNCLIAAALGNTLGGITCYWMGHLGRIDWLERFLKIKKTRVDRMQERLEVGGSFMAFFSFLPVVGGLIAVTLGFMRSNIWLTTASMFMGKTIRYILVLLAVDGIIKLIF